MDLISVDKCFWLIIILNILFIDKPINLPIDLSRAKIMRCILWFAAGQLWVTTCSWGLEGLFRVSQENQIKQNI